MPELTRRYSRALLRHNLDALMVKMRHEGQVENRAVYVAIGIDLEGHKEVLGLWTSANEGARLKDIFIASVDGLKGFPEAIEVVFPQAQVQLCIVHLVRASLNYVSWTERKQVAADLKVYRASTAGEAEQQLASFAAKWNDKYPPIAAARKVRMRHRLRASPHSIATLRRQIATHLARSSGAHAAVQVAEKVEAIMVKLRRQYRPWK